MPAPAPRNAPDRPRAGYRSTTTKLAALALSLTVLGLVPSATQAKGFKPIPAQQFKLVKEGFGAKANRQVRQLAKSYLRKGLGHLLRDTNRVNTGLRRDVSPRGAFGYGWESGDNEVDYWRVATSVRSSARPSAACCATNRRSKRRGAPRMGRPSLLP